jgi:hypothetical protein
VRAVPAFSSTPRLLLARRFGWRTDALSRQSRTLDIVRTGAKAHSALYHKYTYSHLLYITQGEMPRPARRTRNPKVLRGRWTCPGAPGYTRVATILTGQCRRRAASKTIRKCVSKMLKESGRRQPCRSALLARNSSDAEKPAPSTWRCMRRAAYTSPALQAHSRHASYLEFQPRPARWLPARPGNNIGRDIRRSYREWLQFERRRGIWRYEATYCTASQNRGG